MSCVGAHIYTRDTPSWRATANSFPCICKPMLTTRLFHKLLVYVPFFIALTLKVNNFWAFNLNKLVWITWNWHFVSQKYPNIGNPLFTSIIHKYAHMCLLLPLKYQGRTLTVRVKNTVDVNLCFIHSPG